LTTLQTIISELKTDDKSQQVKELCDKIQKEEMPNIDNPDHLPKGPNVFLSLQVPGRNDKEIGFVTLERESPGMYITVFSTIKARHLGKKDVAPKRQKVWPIEDARPEKVLTSYAKTYKFLRGE
jgi:hypothetical protein